MKRLYYLTDSLESADLISRDLYEAGIKDDDLHILCCDEDALRQHHLHAATILQRTDIIRSVERGLIVGGMMSLCFMLPLAYMESFTFNAWLGISAFCIVVSLISGVIGGLAQENYKIYRFHDAVEQGRLLLMVDTPSEQEGFVRRIMSSQHPEAMLQGVTSTLANPFSPTLEMAPIRH